MQVIFSWYYLFYFVRHIWIILQNCLVYTVQMCYWGHKSAKRVWQTCICIWLKEKQLELDWWKGTNWPNGLLSNHLTVCTANQNPFNVAICSMGILAVLYSSNSRLRKVECGQTDWQRARFLLPGLCYQRTSVSSVCVIIMANGSFAFLQTHLILLARCHWQIASQLVYPSTAL